MNERKINGIRRHPHGGDWIFGAQVRGLILVAFAVIGWLGWRNASAAAVRSFVETTDLVALDGQHQPSVNRSQSI